MDLGERSSVDEVACHLVAPANHFADGRYTLLRALGRGGHGAVYEAENTRTGRRVAIKLLHPSVASDAATVGRFLREARSAARIAHPHIVDVLDVSEDLTGNPFIVYELLHGEDLRAHLDRERRLSPRAALEILTPVLEALVAAHAAGVVHRDIKPANIFLVREADGGVRPTLIDFGVSKLLASDAGCYGTTATGMTLGTPHYMSPEQARGDTTIDARADVWSVGVVLFEMLAGRLPFEEPTVALMIARILTQRPPRIDRVAPEVPAEVAAVVAKALEPDRALRHASMQALLDALRGCAPREVVTSPSRRARPASWSIALAAVGVSALLSGMSWSSPRDAAREPPHTHRLRTRVAAEARTVSLPVAAVASPQEAPSRMPVVLPVEAPRRSPPRSARHARVSRPARVIAPTPAEVSSVTVATPVATSRYAIE